MLENYNHKKRELERQWQEEVEKNNRTQKSSQHVRGNPNTKGQFRRKKKAHHKHLMELKREAFEEYKNRYAYLHREGAANLFQTDALKKASNFNKIEKMRNKFFGILGQEEEQLATTDDFPLLTNVDETAVQEAVKESLSRTVDQVHDLIKMKNKKSEEYKKYVQGMSQQKNRFRDHGSIIRGKYLDQRLDSLGNLFSFNPLGVGHVLMNNPNYKDTFCLVAQRLATSERNQMVAEGGAYLVVGMGLAVAGFASMGSSVPILASLALGALAFSTVDHLYQEGKRVKNTDLQRSLLNAYIIGQGDKLSVDDIRRVGHVMSDSKTQARLAHYFAFVDFLGLGPVARARNFIRFAKGINRLSEVLGENTRVLNMIANNGQYVKVVKQIRPQEKVVDLLGYMSKLSKIKQKHILKTLFGTNKKPLSLSALKELENKKILTDKEIDNLKNIIKTISLEKL